MALTLTFAYLLCLVGFALWLRRILKVVKSERNELRDYD